MAAPVSGVATQVAQHQPGAGNHQLAENPDTVVTVRPEHRHGAVRRRRRDRDRLAVVRPPAGLHRP
jgi:hypothetical protein